MGGHFGHLYKLRGIVYYRLSPYELKPFAGLITKGLPNIARRMFDQVFYVAPPFALGYMIYEYSNSENARLSRKNPADYANDV